jgi:hypothetical protein
MSLKVTCVHAEKEKNIQSGFLAFLGVLVEALSFDCCYWLMMKECLAVHSMFETHSLAFPTGEPGSENTHTLLASRKGRPYVRPKQKHSMRWG